MNILVTGSSGLLGTALKKYLGDRTISENNFFQHRSGQGVGKVDLMNRADADFYFKGAIAFGCDTVIHCAAKVGGLKANLDNNNGFFRDNYKINKNVLEIAHECGIKNFVSILTTCVFPDKEVSYPLTADQINNGAPHPSNYGYAYAKRLLGYETNIYRKITGNNWISVIPTNIYGANDNFNLNDAHIIPALIHKAYISKRDNTDFVIWGDGTPLRQFIYSDDLAKIIMWAIENWNKDIPFMAINEKEYSVEEIAIIIARVLDIDRKRIRFDSTKPSGQFRKPGKTDVPSSFKFTPLEEGIKKTVDWFVMNYDRARK